MTQIKTKIPAELEPAAVGGMVTDAKYIKDRVKNKTQKDVNAEFEERVSGLEESVGTGGSVDERITVEKNRAEQAESTLDGKIATEKQRAEGVEGSLNTRLQTVEQLAEISVGGGDIGIGTAADFESDDPEDLAKVPTISAMLGGTNDGVYDISARHSGATYADLSAALGTNGANIPVSLRKGGMSVKFVQSSDNKYVQFRLMANAFSTTISDWQGVDDELKLNSQNVAKSFGVIDSIGYYVFYNGQFVYQETGWNQQRIIFNKQSGLNVGDNVTFRVTNDTGESLTIRCCFDDGTNTELTRTAHDSEYKFTKEGAKIIGFLIYYASALRPNGFLKIKAYYNFGLETDNTNEALKSAIELINNGYQYKGIITENPAFVSPSTPKGKEFYLSTGVGTYTNFGGVTVPYGNIGILKYDSQWSADLINIRPYLGKITAYNGTISKSAAGSSWDSVRRFYLCFSSFGKKVKIKVKNNTGSAFNCNVDLDGSESKYVTIPNGESETVLDYGYNITKIFTYFGADDNPDGSLEVTISCNNFYFIESLDNKLTKSSYSSVTSGGNLLLKVQGDFKAGTPYIIKVDGNIDSNLLLFGLNESSTQLGYVNCGCIYRKTFSSDYNEIRVALNNISETGNASLTVMSESDWQALEQDNKIKVKTCGISNTKTNFKSGFDCKAEVIGDFKANQYYNIDLSGSAPSDNFVLRLYSLDGNQYYSSTDTYVVGRTYIFKCPHDAEKLSIIRNNLVGNVSITINVKESVAVRETRPYPNFVGIPIASHQGCTVGGQTTGSPKAWLAAQKLGYKWMECDIQFTSDNIAVFVHDYPINYRGNHIVRKDNGEPVSPSDNITVGSLTYSQLKGTYRWADGGEILSLVEGFGFLAMLGMNCMLEFKDYASNEDRREYLKTACLTFGIDKLIYNAASTDYKIVFPTLVNLGIYRRGIIGLGSTEESDVEEAFAYAQAIGGACVHAYAFPDGINSAFIQEMMAKYGVQYRDMQWANDNTKYQAGMIVSDDIAPVKDYYANESSLLSNTNVNYNDWTSAGSVTLAAISNVNIAMIADEGVEVKFDNKSAKKGCSNTAYIMSANTYTVYIKGTGHIAELSVRY